MGRAVRFFLKRRGLRSFSPGRHRGDGKPLFSVLAAAESGE